MPQHSSDLTSASSPSSYLWPAATCLAIICTNATTWYLSRRLKRRTASADAAVAAGSAIAASNVPAEQTIDAELGVEESEEGIVSEIAQPALQPGSSQTFQTSHTINTGKTDEKTLRRTVHCMDTNEYLRSIAAVSSITGYAPLTEKSSAPSKSSSTSSYPLPGTWSNCSVITSVPDVSETGLSLPKWRNWFKHVCVGILQKVEKEQVAIFYQTDIRAEEQWISKAFLVMQAAEKVGMRLNWHKIVLINNTDTVRGSTSTYVHLLCFSHSHIENALALTPDVIAHRGTMLWKRAMGLRACEFAIKYIKLHVPTATTVVDPFCGSGSTLSMANLFGLHSIGVDHCRKRCVQASTLKIDLQDLGGPNSQSVQQFEKKKEEQAKLRKQQRAESGRTQREQQMWEKEQRRLERSL